MQKEVACGTCKFWSPVQNNRVMASVDHNRELRDNSDDEITRKEIRDQEKMYNVKVGSISERDYQDGCYVGQCQRYPPVIVDDIPEHELPLGYGKARLLVHSRWPQTWGSDACGEWRES